MFVTSKKRLTQSNPKLVISTKETTAIATREANPRKKLDKVSFMFIIPKAKPAQSNSNLVISTKEKSSQEALQSISNLEQKKKEKS